jgi:hypothetical protein
MRRQIRATDLLVDQRRRAAEVASRFAAQHSSESIPRSPNPPTQAIFSPCSKEVSFGPRWAHCSRTTTQSIWLAVLRAHSILHPRPDGVAPSLLERGLTRRFPKTSKRPPGRYELRRGGLIPLPVGPRRHRDATTSNPIGPHRRVRDEVSFRVGRGAGTLRVTIGAPCTGPGPRSPRGRD